MTAKLPRGWKKKARERARTILHTAPLEEPLPAEADTFLRELLARHPHSATKVGCGAAWFEVRINRPYNQPGFWLVRKDGTETDFSYIACLNPPSPMDDFRAACRVAVVDQIQAFRRCAFGDALTLACPVTGETITPDNCHVDHAPPWTFEEIVALFAAGKNIAALVEPGRDGDLFTRFRDPETASLFARLHAACASLRVVSVKANLSVLRRRDGFTGPPQLDRSV